jgi:hypothetical protein
MSTVALASPIRSGRVSLADRLWELVRSEFASEVVVPFDDALLGMAVCGVPGCGPQAACTAGARPTTVAGTAPGARNGRRGRRPPTRRRSGTVRWRRAGRRVAGSVSIAISRATSTPRHSAAKNSPRWRVGSTGCPRRPSTTQSCARWPAATCSSSGASPVYAHRTQPAGVAAAGRSWPSNCSGAPTTASPGSTCGD